MTFSEFRQFLAATSSFREQVPYFSRSFSAPINNGLSSGKRGIGLGEFTANSVGRLAGDGKGTGKEAVGYFERLFESDLNTVEGDFDVFTAPRLAVCRPAATVAPARPVPSLINPDSSAFPTNIQNGRREQTRLEVKGKLKVKVNREGEGEGKGKGGQEEVREGEGEGVREAAGIKDSGYSLFFNEDDMMSGDYLFKVPDNNDTTENNNNNNDDNNNNCNNNNNNNNNRGNESDKINHNGDNNSDGEYEIDEGKGKVTVRKTFSRHFTTPEKVSPKPKRAFYGNKRNFLTEDAKVAGEEREGEGGERGGGGGRGAEGSCGGGGQEGGEAKIDGREARSGRREGYSTDELCKYWQDNEDREGGEENEAKPSPFYTHTMCQLDQLEGTEGMRSL